MAHATPRSRSSVAAHPGTAAVITLLIVVSILLSLITPIYARTGPRLGDFPFFYWYLLVIMPVISFFLWLATVLQKRLSRPGEAGGDPR